MHEPWHIGLDVMWCLTVQTENHVRNNSHLSGTICACSKTNTWQVIVSWKTLCRKVSTLEKYNLIGIWGGTSSWKFYGVQTSGIGHSKSHSSPTASTWIVRDEWEGRHLDFGLFNFYPLCIPHGTEALPEHCSRPSAQVRGYCNGNSSLNKKWKVG